MHQKIIEALSDVVSGNIWPESCPYEEPPDEFIVFCDAEDNARDFGDDEAGAWTHDIEVNWFKRGPGGKAVNYLEKRKEIIRRLKDAGFSVYRILPGYELDSGYTTLVFLFETID